MTQILAAQVPGAPEIAAACLEVMRAALSDCPFDQEACVHLGDVALACRLASVAPEAPDERLPHVDRAAALALTIDARLDDREHLCRVLGHGPRTPDGTLVAAAWLRWGAGAVQHLHGDYALVAAELDRGALVCARDALGVRPLYYAQLQRRGQPDGLLVASDLRPLRAALAQLDHTGPTLDAAFVVAHLRDNLSWHPTATFIAQIRRVPPGHLLRWHDGKLHLLRWWRPERIPVDRQVTLANAVGRLRPVLEQAAADRLRADVPVGLHISGGLDSSLTAALSTTLLRARGTSPRLCWTWSPPSTEVPPPPDWGLAVRTAEHLGLELRSIDLSTADAQAFLQLDPVDLPLESSIAYELKGLSWATQAGVRTIVSGWGGDEAVSFHGGAYHADLFLRGRWGLLLDELRRMGVWHPRAVLRLLAKPLLPWQRLNRMQRRNGPGVLSPWAAQAVQPLPPAGNLPARPRAQMLWRLTRGQLSHRLESCAAFGARRRVAYVYPLLDRRVVEAVLSFDAHVLRRGHETRSLARALAAPLLPAEVVSHTRKDDDWTVARLRDRLRESLAQLAPLAETTHRLAERSRFVSLSWLDAGLQAPSLEPLECYVDALRFVRAGSAV